MKISSLYIHISFLERSLCAYKGVGVCLYGYEPNELWLRAFYALYIYVNIYLYCMYEVE